MKKNTNPKAQFQEAKKTPIDFKGDVLSVKQVKNRYKASLRKIKKSPDTAGEKYAFKCQNKECQNHFNTIKTVKGRIDIVVDCPKCKGNAVLSERNDKLPAAYVWGRETLERLLEVRETHPNFVKYVLSGGLNYELKGK